MLWFSTKVLSEVKKDHSNPLISYFLFISFELFNLTKIILVLELVYGVKGNGAMQNKTAKSLPSPTDIWALLFGISVVVKSRDWLKRKHIIRCFAYIPTVPLREELHFVCWDRCKAAMHVICSLRGNNLSFLSAQGVDFDFVSWKWSCTVSALKFATSAICNQADWSSA